MNNKAGDLQVLTMALKLSARLRTSSFNLLLYDFSSASLLTVTSLFASLFTIAILTGFMLDRL